MPGRDPRAHRSAGRRHRHTTRTRYLTMRSTLLMMIGLSAAGTLHAADSKSYAEHVPATPTGPVHIGNISGSVTVSGWDKSEVEITGELGAKVERVEVTHDEQGVNIKVVLP